MGTATLEGEKGARLVVGTAVDPAAVKDANPLKGERAQGRVVGRAASALLVVEGARPEGLRDGLAGPLDEGLSSELGGNEAPVDPSGLAAALGDWSDTGVFLDGVGAGEA